MATTVVTNCEMTSSVEENGDAKRDRLASLIDIRDLRCGANNRGRRALDLAAHKPETPPSKNTPTTSRRVQGRIDRVYMVSRLHKA